MKIQSISKTTQLNLRMPAGSSSSARGTKDAKSTKSSAGSETTDTPYYDARDLDRDGYVSYYEKTQYSLVYPEFSDEEGNETTQRDAKGQTDTRTGTRTGQIPKSIDIIV